MLFKVEADLDSTTTTTNHKEQLDSIFISMIDDIEDDTTINDIKAALEKGMSNLGSNFGGKKAIIDQYVKTKRDEIKAIRERHKKQRTDEVIEAFLYLFCTLILICSFIFQL